jgi:uncharacterized protein YndB with AHSA1/START domain
MVDATVDQIGLLADRELFTSRAIDADRERVFAAFSDQDQLARWWGPKDFTNTFQEFDLRAGGNWRFIMHGPEGAQHPNHSRFVEVTPPERVVLEHLSAPQFEMTITFDEQDSRTTVGWRQRFQSPEECQRIAKFAVAANEQNLDRLEAHLASAPRSTAA